MSTLKIDDMQSRTGGTPTINGKKVICSAWVNFNGTGTVLIRDQENVSSITDISTGTYEINFATTMADANYAISAAYSNEVNVTHGVLFMDHVAVNNTTSKFRVTYYNPFQSANIVNKAYCSFQVFGGT
jgi:hypothetical protein